MQDGYAETSAVRKWYASCRIWATLGVRWLDFDVSSSSPVHLQRRPPPPRPPSTPQMSQITFKTPWPASGALFWIIRVLWDDGMGSFWLGCAYFTGGELFLFVSTLTSAFLIVELRSTGVALPSPRAARSRAPPGNSYPSLSSDEPRSASAVRFRHPSPSCRSADLISGSTPHPSLRTPRVVAAQPKSLRCERPAPLGVPPHRLSPPAFSPPRFDIPAHL